MYAITPNAPLLRSVSTSAPHATKNDTEQERADFEAWANGRCELHLVNPAGMYSSATTQFAWEAYQAGRAALLAERDALKEALSKYASQENWEHDEHGWARLWLEPDSTSRQSYDGTELARAALSQGQGD